SLTDEANVVERVHKGPALGLQSLLPDQERDAFLGQRSRCSGQHKRDQRKRHPSKAAPNLPVTRRVLFPTLDIVLAAHTPACAAGAICAQSPWFDSRMATGASRSLLSG